MYESLVSDVEKALACAARFRKADLHVHSYESHDFPVPSDKPGGVVLTSDDHVCDPDAFLSGMPLRDRCLDIVAITDHNVSREACKLALREFSDALVLPGIEMTVRCTEFAQETVHVVALFPKGTRSETIDQVFASSGNAPI